MTFEDVVAEAAGNPEFVEEWDRLRGGRLAALGRRSPLERIVDEATGFESELGATIAREFIADVTDLIWDRLTR